MAACLAATACYASAGFLTRCWITQRGGLDSRLVAMGSQVGAVVLLLPFAAWHEATQPAAWVDAPPRVWVAVQALGLFSTSWAYVLYFRLIAEVGPVKAMTVTLLIPLFGVLWGWWFLDEAATAAHAVGGSLIALALWCVLRPAPGAAPADAEVGRRRHSPPPVRRWGSSAKPVAKTGRRLRLRRGHRAGDRKLTVGLAADAHPTRPGALNVALTHSLAAAAAQPWR